MSSALPVEGVGVDDLLDEADAEDCRESVELIDGCVARQASESVFTLSPTVNPVDFSPPERELGMVWLRSDLSKPCKNCKDVDKFSILRRG
mmetsp:Transcript_26287/g.25129  ORF Transcript_26287/g.25129 Transcript_26287/m.25129 type:complete len:91 (+) Transcript_26287:5402-5674(+)